MGRINRKAKTKTQAPREGHDLRQRTAEPDASTPAHNRAADTLRFQANLLDAVEQAVIVTDLDGTIVYWNRFAETLYGWSAPEVIDRNILDITPAAATRAPATELMARLRQGESWSSEFLVRRRDGTTFLAQVSDSPVYDADGQLIGIIGLSSDITALRESEARTRAILEAALDCIITIDHTGRVLEFNPAAEQTFGYDRDAVLGHELADLVIPPHLRAQHRHGLRHYLATGEGPVLGKRIELPALRADGTEFPVELAITRILTDGPPLFTGFLRDITKRKLADEERTQLLERERAARAEAQEAVWMRDVFFSVASHELKTPLTSLMGQAQLLHRRALRDGMHERDLRSIAVIAAQASRLNKMILALLDVSRLETGQLSIERTPLDLEVLARRVVAEIQPTLEKHTVTCNGPDLPLFVEGDELRLEQVLQNLIQNAIKYSPTGGQVTVHVTQRGTTACVAVTDEGMGIPQEALPRLFGRFYRARNAEVQQIAGMGIGLFVVKEIVTMHGGTMEVESSEGIGSTFTICLPALI